jgi:hypothetical protein
MTCTACTVAEISPRTSQRENGCASCLARMLALTGAHEESKRRGKLTPAYRDALKQCFSIGDGWKAGAEAVKAWDKKIHTSTAMDRETTAGHAPTKKRNGQ